MTRKLSTITTAKVVILSETTKQMTEKASHASRAGGSTSSFYLFHLRMTHSWNGCAASPAAAFVHNGYLVAGAGMLSAARRMRSLRSRSAPFSCPASSSVKPPCRRCRRCHTSYVGTMAPTYQSMCVLSPSMKPQGRCHSSEPSCR